MAMLNNQMVTMMENAQKTVHRGFKVNDECFLTPAFSHHFPSLLGVKKGDSRDASFGAPGRPATARLVGDAQGGGL